MKKSLRTMRDNKTDGYSQRQLRVGEEIRHALVQVMRRGNIRDPALADANITVTEVRVASDLKSATAFVLPLGGAKMQEAVEALNRAAPFIRGQVSKIINLRFSPKIAFSADTSLDSASRIESLLKKIKTEEE